jgi:hypothetical protein
MAPIGERVTGLYRLFWAAKMRSFGGRKKTTLVGPQNQKMMYDKKITAGRT